MATTAPRKRTPKKAGAAPPKRDGGPLRIGEGPVEPVEMQTIFVIDDVEYKVPAKPDPRLGLRFLRESRDPAIGAQEALARLTVDFLGEENLLALEQAPNVSVDDVAAVFAAVQRVVLGGNRKATDPS